MKIELRNVKHAAFASQETACFQATVVIDGVNAGTVSNEGHGGCHRYSSRATEQQIEAYAAKLPEVECEALMGEDGKPWMMQPNADLVISELLDAFLTERALKKLLASKVVMERKDGKLVALKKVTPDQLKTLLADPADLMKKFKTVSVLNVMPFDEALKIYAASAG